MNEGKALVSKLSELSMWNILIWGNCCNCIGPDYAKQLDELNIFLWSLVESLRLEQMRNVTELVCLARHFKDRQDDMEKRQAEMEKKVDGILRGQQEVYDILIKQQETIQRLVPNSMQQAPSSSGVGAADPALGVVFRQLVDAVIQVKIENMMFKCLLDTFKSTLYCLQPLIEEVAEHGRVVHLPEQEVEKLIIQIVNGVELVHKCSKVERNMKEAIDSANNIEMAIKKIEDEDLCDVQLPELLSTAVGFDMLNMQGLRDVTEEALLDSASVKDEGVKQTEGLSDVLPELLSPADGLDVLNMQGSLDLITANIQVVVTESEEIEAIDNSTRNVQEEEKVELGHSTPSSHHNPQFNSMLEGPSYLVSKQLPSSCEQESRWMYNTERVLDFSNSKRPLEDGEEMALMKVCKHADAVDRVEAVMDNLALSHANSDQPNDQNHEGKKYDPASLFHQLGRDVSVDCLVRCSRADYGSVAMLCRSFHSLIRSGELYTLRRKMGIVEHWAYFSCALSEWWAFNPDRGRWMPLPKIESNESFMYSDKESLAVGTELLVFGKEIMSHVCYKYSLLTHRWSSGRLMNTPRFLFASASSGEIAIVAGGCDLCGNILSTAELYNSETGTWLTLPSMHEPRRMCSGVFMDGKFYVIGGIGGSSAGEVYDLERGTWTEIPNMHPRKKKGAGATDVPAIAGSPPLVAVVNNILYAADWGKLEVRKYDKERNVWVTIGGLPERTYSINGWGVAFRACGNRLIIIGGRRGSSVEQIGVEQIEVNSWVPDEGPPQWNLLAIREDLRGFVYNCSVMGC
ncbi:F-box/kelch-repeat protein At1g74510 isoform X2 [Rosa chinensis]|uniref:F-box/kelch-repeat protein At1g74510 isoform X2 n=1 Tax=Rosa chinensis TaxID=74649 RepID=UPI001AD8AD5E|nr:F-box/kelch-repeat protein At1g74510 isoform X2 [Rosa chinensis]